MEIAVTEGADAVSGTAAIVGGAVDVVSATSDGDCSSR